MDSLHDEQETVSIGQLSARQRREVYELEKWRIEHSAPVFTRQSKIIAGAIASGYLLGSLIIYSGIAVSVLDFFSTGQWKFKPDIGFFDDLFSAVFTLLRPVAAAFMLYLAIVWPAILLCAFGLDFFEPIKRWYNRK